jgi:SAM-dependent methyltransferase
VDAEKLANEYCEALGPRPKAPTVLLDIYRFCLVYQHLSAGSVLDVGVYFGDFLKMVRRGGYKIFGTEANSGRRDFANSILGEDVIVVDFRNGRLSNFQDDNVDNAVCMEVVEHIPDDKFAVSELCRVARTKVLITVPFREKIKSILCVNCNKYTPYSGHRHSYDFGTFSKLIPTGWRVTMERPFCNRLVNLLGARLPKLGFFIPILRLIDCLIPGNRRWMLIILEPLKT